MLHCQCGNVHHRPSGVQIEGVQIEGSSSALEPGVQAEAHQGVAIPEMQVYAMRRECVCFFEPQLNMPACIATPRQLASPARQGGFWDRAASQSSSPVDQAMLVDAWLRSSIHRDARRHGAPQQNACESMQHHSLQTPHCAGRDGAARCDSSNTVLGFAQGFPGNYKWLQLPPAAAAGRASTTPAATIPLLRTAMCT